MIIRYLCLLGMLLLSSAVLTAQQQTKQRPKTIKATVVAENIFNRSAGCWHVCGLHLLVRLEGKRANEYALVVVTYMDDRSLKTKGDHWKLVEKTGKWEFEATLDDPASVTLSKFANTRNLSTGADTTEQTQINQWILLKGSENEALPFGKSIASYSVGFNKFRPIDQ